MATFVLAAVPLLQALVGLIHFAGDAWVVCAYLLAFGLAQLLGQAMASRLGMEVLAQRLAVLLVACALACVGLQLYQWLQLEGLGAYVSDLAPGRSPYANVSQPNHLASMLFLGLVGMLFLYERQQVRGSVAALGCVVIEFGLALTASRTAWLAMALLGVALIAMRRRAGLRIGGTAVVATLALFAGLLLARGPLGDLLLLSQGRTLGHQAEVGPRPQIWASMLDAISRQPWFGYGWNQGLVAHGRVVDAHPILGRLTEHSHNLVLDLMIWNGVPIALALTAFLAWWFWRQAVVARSAARVYLLVGIAAMFIHALVEYPLSYLYFLLPVGLMMGALDSAVPWRWQWHVPRWGVGTATAAAAALAIVIVAEYVEIEGNMRILRFEVARIGTSKIESKTPELVLLTQLREYLRFVRLAPHAGMTSAELETMRRVAERFPYAASLYKLALAEALNGRPQEAQQMLAHLCLMHTARRCRDSLQEWRRVAASEHPQIAAVALPAPP
jgi:O-antigen ligase